MDKAMREKQKNTSPAAKSIFFCKRITVNEASAHDKYSRGSGAFLLPKINWPTDDDPRLTTTKERITHLWIMKISKRGS